MKWDTGSLLMNSMYNKKKHSLITTENTYQYVYLLVDLLLLIPSGHLLACSSMANRSVQQWKQLFGKTSSSDHFLLLIWV